MRDDMRFISDKNNNLKYRGRNVKIFFPRYRYKKIKSIGGQTIVSEQSGDFQLLNATSKQVKSQSPIDTTLATVDTAEIANKYFPDGMRSAGSVFDELDFEHKKAILRTGIVDLGTLNYGHNGTLGSNTVFLSVAGTLPDRAYTQNCLCGRFSVGPLSSAWNMAPRTNSGRIEFSVPSAEFTKAADFKAAMSGVMLHYELAEPVETKITEDLRYISKILSEDGGSLEFLSTLDDEGIHVDVPHTEEWMNE